MPELFFSWGFWYVVGAAVVVIAAALLITILFVARGIEKEAARALHAARRIEHNTRAIPALAGALTTLETIRSHAGNIAGQTEMLAGALHGEPGSAQARR